jgi:hypothetical protein
LHRPASASASTQATSPAPSPRHSTCTSPCTGNRPLSAVYCSGAYSGAPRDFEKGCTAWLIKCICGSTMRVTRLSAFPSAVCYVKRHDVHQNKEWWKYSQYMKI